ncbi:MAG: nucleotidyltransferase family protein [Bacteroidales bacterium]|nr:nucleotidyltransferase family protein [Bacteroidales bacterium]
MKALIFAAGFGTRLKPLTDNKPKALVEVNGVPMLGLLIEKLKSFGFTEIVINVHHFAEMIKNYLNENNNFDIKIEISDESETLFDTGGGLIHAKRYLENTENFLIHNVDIFTDINLRKMMEFHKEKENLVSLAVKTRTSSKYLQFDEENLLCGWRDVKTGNKIIARDVDIANEFAFSGIHVVNSKIFDLIDKQGKFSIIPEYLRLAETEKIGAFVHNENLIIDIGKHETLKKVEELLKK